LNYVFLRFLKATSKKRKKSRFFGFKKNVKNVFSNYVRQAHATASAYRTPACLQWRRQVLQVEGGQIFWGPSISAEGVRSGEERRSPSQYGVWALWGLCPRKIKKSTLKSRIFDIFLQAQMVSTAVAARQD